MNRSAFTLLATLVFSLLPVCTAALHAQDTVITLPPASGAPAGKGFSSFVATPISPTAVLISVMDATDSRATLGFALVIRGPEGWYNAPTQYKNLPEAELSAGAVGQDWQVGERRFSLEYDSHRQTLTTFGASVDLRPSRVVLVSLAQDSAAPATVTSGRSVSFTMDGSEHFVSAFLPLAPEVREFAGLELKR